MVTLGGLNRFEERVFTEELQEQSEAVVGVAANLEGTHSRPTYFSVLPLRMQPAPRATGLLGEVRRRAVLGVAEAERSTDGRV